VIKMLGFVKKLENWIQGSSWVVLIGINLKIIKSEVFYGKFKLTF